MTPSAQTLRRALGCAGVLTVTLVWVGAGAAPWLSERLSAAARAGAPFSERLARVLWADAPGRIAARRLLLGFGAGDGEAERRLAESLRARPLYAPTWLARARLALRSGDPARADAYATASTRLWPQRSRHLWRVAMLWIEMGDHHAAFHALRGHQRGRRSAMDRVLWIGAQLEPDPERLATALRPGADWKPSESDAYRTQLLAAAARTGRMPVVESAWEGLSEEARGNPHSIRAYVELLLSAGRVEKADAIWSRYWRKDAAEGPITNADFEEALALGGLGWIVRAVPGVTWKRDRDVRFRGGYSLRLDFDSREEFTYRHAFQSVPVEPGRRYRLRGRWRGSEVTTLSGPFVEVVSFDTTPPLEVKGAARTGSWEWSPFELDFRAPPDARLVKVRVRRDRDTGLARGISGALWLDDLELLPLREGTRDG